MSGGGVDGFLILSGLGCYYSYHKIHSVKKYYIRRVTRILPTYIFVIVCYAVFCILIVKSCTVSQYLYNYSLITFWTNGVLKEWYVAALIVLYIVSPLMFELVDKSKTIYMILTTVIMSISVLFSMINLPDNLSIINEVFGCRISAFMIGGFLATFDTPNNVKANTKKFLVERILEFALVSAIWWGIYNLEIPCRMVLLRLLFLPIWLILFSIMSTIMDCSQKQYKILSGIGAITFELYLVHEKILGITFFVCYRLVGNQIIRTIIDNIIAVLLSIVCAYIIHKIMNLKIILKKGDKF